MRHFLNGFEICIKIPKILVFNNPRKVHHEYCRESTISLPVGHGFLALLLERIQTLIFFGRIILKFFKLFFRTNTLADILDKKVARASTETKKHQLKEYLV